MPQTIYTEEEYDEVNSDKRVLEDVVRKILRYHRAQDEDRSAARARKEKTSKMEKDRYVFIPNEIHRVIKDLNTIKKYFSKQFPTGIYCNKKFVDCGSGIGWVVSIANSMGFQSTGIEYDEGNVKSSKMFTRGVVQGDILKHNYKEYDVIYYYVPIQNGTVQRKFEKKVEDEMKVGAILYTCGKQDRTINKDKRFKPLDGHSPIWEKVRKGYG